MSKHQAKPEPMPEAYDFHAIEERWQQVWEKNSTFAAPDDDWSEIRLG